jgi:hypothetical protein
MFVGFQNILLVRKTSRVLKTREVCADLKKFWGRGRTPFPKPHPPEKQNRRIQHPESRRQKYQSAGERRRNPTL